MHKLQDIGHPVLILVRGLPGSGKTYLTKELQTTIGEESVVMLDPDATDYLSQEYVAHTKALMAEGVDPELHAYRFLRSQAYAGIAARKIIIWNQPFTSLEIFNKMVGRLLDKASEHDTSLLILVVEVEIDPAMAKQRVDERKNTGGHGPSDTTFERFINNYESFASHGYTTVTVPGDGGVSASVSSVLEALQKLLHSKS